MSQTPAAPGSPATATRAHLHALADLGARLRRASDKREALEEAVQTVAAILDCPLAEVLELDAEGTTYLLAAGVGWSPELVGDARLPATLADGRGLSADDVPAAPAWDLRGTDGATVGLRVPIPGTPQPFGLLGVHTPSSRMLSPEDMDFARTAAHLLSGALDRMRWETELEELRHDPGQRLELQPQLAQSQKLEAVGELAGGVAHDFNNLLTVVLGYVEILLDEVDADSPLRNDLEGINRAAQRAATLVHQLLAFSRRQVLQPTVFDLNETLRSLESMLHRLIGENIDLVVHTSEEPARIRADQSQIEQVVVNLAINARDAMPEGGTITLETETLAAALGGSAHTQAGKRYVDLTVTDTGVGMDAETLSHCFEPFFTTKEPGRGTGLGLATVFGIVRQSEGDIWAESDPGVGTTFTVRLPAAGARALDVQVSPDADVFRQGTETVLLVEDEEEVRWLARRALLGAGYQVLEAANGVEALDVAHDHDGVIHVLVTDVVMPHLGGVELANRLQLEERVGAVLFVSGYLDRAAEMDGGGIAGDQLLTKPFRAMDLLARVRQTLDGESSSSRRKNG